MESNRFINSNLNTFVNSEIIFSWDNQYAMIVADNNGKWSANFGAMEKGSHAMLITEKNDIGNSSTKTINISVKTADQNTTGQSILFPILNGIKKGISSLVPKTNPAKVSIIPKKIPKVFTQNWNLLPVKHQKDS